MKRIEKSDVWLTIAVGVLGWVLVTLYGLNGRVNSQGAQINGLTSQIASVQTTTSSIYDFLLLGKSSSFTNGNLTSMSN